MSDKVKENIAAIQAAFSDLASEVDMLRDENTQLHMRLKMMGGGLPTRYALNKLGVTNSSSRTCRTCDNYCNGPMDCDGCKEETCLTWTPRPGHDVDGKSIPTTQKDN